MFSKNVLLTFSILPLIFCNSIIDDSIIEYNAKLPEYKLEVDVHPDSYLNVKEIILKYGYPLEVHHVTTADGYILEMHRIPHGKDHTNVDPNRPVVLLMHGILCSSADWVVTGVDKGLGFLLADAGYDVWMGNSRGNTWSRNHTIYDPVTNARKFWDFSFHEMGYYDLPVTIDRILDVTQQEKIFYIGHSQGTTIFFVLLSERPEYNAKISMMSAFAPVSYVGNIPNVLFRFIASFQGPLEVLEKLIGSFEFLPNNEFMQIAGQTLCQESSPLQAVCINIVFLMCGYDSAQLNETVLPVIVSRTPAGSSTKQFIHYAQEVNSRKFRQYDYGLIKNLMIYNSFTPPKYNIQNIQVPVVIYYSDNDKLVSTKDAEQLAQELPNLIQLYKVPFKQFNHLDFLWANDVKTLLYDETLNQMTNY